MRTLLLVLTLLVGCQSGTLVAERIVLVDAAGEPQVYLGLDETGERRGLFVLDSKGRLRAGLTLVGEGVELLLTDTEERERVRLWTKGEASGWSLRDPETPARISARVEAGEVQLRCVDREGAESVRLPFR